MTFHERQLLLRVIAFRSVEIDPVQAQVPEPKVICEDENDVWRIATGVLLGISEGCRYQNGQ